MFIEFALEDVIICNNINQINEDPLSRNQRNILFCQKSLCHRAVKEYMFNSYIMNFTKCVHELIFLSFITCKKELGIFCFYLSHQILLCLKWSHNIMCTVIKEDSLDYISLSGKNMYLCLISFINCNQKSACTWVINCISVF